MTVASQIRGLAIGAFLGPTGQRIARGLRHLRHGGGAIVELYHDPADPISLLLVQQMARWIDAAERPPEGRLWVVGGPAADVDPAPADRRAWRAADAARLAAHHGLELLLPAAVESPRTAAARAALTETLPFRAHLARAIALGRELGAGISEAPVAAASAPAPPSAAEMPAMVRPATLHDARMRARGFYEGGAIYHRGAWFPGLDRWDHFVSAATGEALGPPRTPTAARVLRPGDTLTLFFSFRSPYSYLALQRSVALAGRSGAQLRLRPVLPMVMRNLAVPRIKRLFLAQDAAREARRHGIPYGRIADPLGAGVERCLAVMHHLTEPAARQRFSTVATTAIWSQARDVADDGDLRDIAAAAGIDWGTVQAALADASWRQAVDENQRALRAAGVWGVPSFVVGDTVLWGQDRLPWLASA